MLFKNDENDVLLPGPGNVLQTHFLSGFDEFANGLLFQFGEIHSWKSFNVGQQGSG